MFHSPFRDETAFDPERDALHSEQPRALQRELSDEDAARNVDQRMLFDQEDGAAYRMRKTRQTPRYQPGILPQPIAPRQQK